MSDSTQSFSPANRVRLCLACGATMTVPLEGGDLACDHCATLVQVPPRTMEPLGEHGASLDDAVETPEEHRTRLAMLQKQVKQYNRGNRYATVQAPEGYEKLAQLPEGSEETLNKILEAYREAYQRCQQQPIPQNEQAVYYLTWKLKNIYVQLGRSTHAWSVIQTSMDLLTDPGYQHLLRSMAANKARNAGELESAEAWLALCDPAPRILDLDTKYRTTLATYYLASQQWARALALVGAGPFDVPFEPSAMLLVPAIRVTALEKLGRGFEAEEAMRELQTVALGNKNAIQSMLGPTSIFAPARATWARIRHDSLLENDEMLPPGNRRLVIAGILGLIAVVLVAVGIYQVKIASFYRSWKPVDGKILKVHTREVRQGGESRIGVGVSYIYKVDGKTHEGNQVEPGDRYYVYSRSRDAQKKAASLRAHPGVTIYYNPKKPAQAALARAWIGELLGALVAFIIAAGLLLGAFFLIKLHRKRHRAHEAWKARDAQQGAGAGGAGSAGSAGGDGGDGSEDSG